MAATAMTATPIEAPPTTAAAPISGGMTAITIRARAITFTTGAAIAIRGMRNTAAIGKRGANIAATGAKTGRAITATGGTTTGAAATGAAAGAERRPRLPLIRGRP